MYSLQHVCPSVCLLRPLLLWILDVYWMHWSDPQYTVCSRPSPSSCTEVILSHRVAPLWRGADLQILQKPLIGHWQKHWLCCCWEGRQKAASSGDGAERVLLFRILFSCFMKTFGGLSLDDGRALKLEISAGGTRETGGGRNNWQMYNYIFREWLTRPLRPSVTHLSCWLKTQQTRACTWHPVTALSLVLLHLLTHSW